MLHRTRYNVISVAESFCRKAERMASFLDGGVPPGHETLGTTLALYREISSALNLLPPDSEQKAFQLRVEDSMKRLRLAMDQNVARVLDVAREELSAALRRLEDYVRDFRDNVAEELTDMLDWRSSVHELVLILEGLGDDLTEPRQRLKAIDSTLRDRELWFMGVGVARADFWLQAAPPEYWWWRLADREGA
jgi:hypothetical protein